MEWPTHGRRLFSSAALSVAAAAAAASTAAEQVDQQGHRLMSKRALLFVSAYARDLVFLAGMLCVSSGLAMVSLPAALIAPGALLVWLSIPPRTK